MIPDFPIDIRIRLAELKFFLFLPDFANFLSCLSKTKQANRAENQQSQEATKKISILPILFLCQQESLVSSNLNSKQLRFHSVRPNIHTPAKQMGIFTMLLQPHHMPRFQNPQWRVWITQFAIKTNNTQSLKCSLRFSNRPIYTRRVNIYYDIWWLKKELSMVHGTLQFF